PATDVGRLVEVEELEPHREPGAAVPGLGLLSVAGDRVHHQTGPYAVVADEDAVGVRDRDLLLDLLQAGLDLRDLGRDAGSGVGLPQSLEAPPLVVTVEGDAGGVDGGSDVELAQVEAAAAASVRASRAVASSGVAGMTGAARARAAVPAGVAQGEQVA